MSIAQGGGEEWVELPEGGCHLAGGLGHEAEEAGADAVGCVAHFGVDEVVDELYVEEGVVWEPRIAEEVGEGVGKAFQVETELCGGGGGDEGGEVVEVELVDRGGPDGVGRGGHEDFGPGEVYGEVLPRERGEHLRREPAAVHTGGIALGWREIEEGGLAVIGYWFVADGWRLVLGSGGVLRKADGFFGVGEAEVGEHLARKLAELELIEDGVQEGVVGFLESQLRLVEIDRCIETDGCELLGEEGLVGMLVDEVAEFVVFDVVGMGDHLLDGAKLRDEFFGGLLADPRDAGDVV